MTQGFYQELFPTVVGFYDLELDNERFYSFIKQLESNKDGRHLDDLVFQTKGDLHTSPILSELNYHCQASVVEYLNTHKYRFDPSEVYISNCWATLSRNMVSTHRAHIHRNTLISAVYFVRCPQGAGKLYFPYSEISREMLRAEETELHPYNWMEYVVDPKPGLLVVFKSSTQHGVEQNRFIEQTDERLTIAYTFNLKNIGQYSDYAKSV